MKAIRNFWFHSHAWIIIVVSICTILSAMLVLLLGVHKWNDGVCPQCGDKWMLTTIIAEKDGSTRYTYADEHCHSYDTIVYHGLGG